MQHPHRYATPTPGVPAPVAPRKFQAKGHDAQLQDAQMSGKEVIVTLLSGESLTGQIVKRDKWTITLREFEAIDTVIVYKHAIETLVIKSKSIPTGDA